MQLHQNRCASKNGDLPARGRVFQTWLESPRLAKRLSACQSRIDLCEAPLAVFSCPELFWARLGSLAVKQSTIKIHRCPIRRQGPWRGAHTNGSSKESGASL